MGSTVNFKALYWAAEAHKPFCNDITKAIDVTNETEWGSQKTDLFTSDSKGKVTGHKTGSGSLRGEYNGMVDLAMVHVVESSVPLTPPPVIDIIANPNLIRSGNTSEIVIDINSENDLDCSLDGVSKDTIHFLHTSNPYSQTYKYTTRPLANAQIIRVICEVKVDPSVSATKEIRINVVPYLQEI